MQFLNKNNNLVISENVIQQQKKQRLNDLATNPRTVRQKILLGALK